MARDKVKRLCERRQRRVSSHSTAACPLDFRGAKTSWVGDVVLASTPQEVSASYRRQRAASTRRQETPGPH